MKDSRLTARAVTKLDDALTAQDGRAADFGCVLTCFACYYALAPGSRGTAAAPWCRGVWQAEAGRYNRHNCRTSGTVLGVTDDDGVVTASLCTHAGIDHNHCVWAALLLRWHSRVAEKAFLKAIGDAGMLPTRAQQTAVVAFLSKAPDARRTVNGLSYKPFIKMCNEALAGDAAAGGRSKVEGGEGKMAESKPSAAATAAAVDPKLARKIATISPSMVTSVRQKYQRGSPRPRRCLSSSDPCADAGVRVRVLVIPLRPGSDQVT